MALMGALAWASGGGTVRAEPTSSPAQRLLAEQYVDEGIAAQRSSDYDAAIA